MSTTDKKPQSKFPWTWAVAAAAVVLIVAVVVWQLFLTGPGDDELVSVTAAVEMIESGDVTAVRMDDMRRTVELVNDDHVVGVAAYPVGYGPELVDLALRSGVEVSAEKTSAGSGGLAVLQTFVVIALIATVVIVVTRKSRAGGGTGVASLPVGRAKAAESAVRFTDVAGSREVVEELREVVDYLKHPERFTTTGATLPKGFLLVGPPGTGKTLLAKAVAGEAGVPFFAVAGSDFVETYVGVGASRVRQVFNEARKSERAIIFIDEIDAVGRARQSGAVSGSREESEHTLNALLVEMDGFRDSTVIVMAATNRADILDDALLRPGRFDRRIHVGLPDRPAREAILRVHLEERPHDPGIDLAAFARRCVGCSGAELANVCNEAALVAGRANKTRIEAGDLDEALATTVLGRERKDVERTLRDQQITTWHEAGHATVALALDELPDPVAVSVLPRGQAGGVTWLDGSDDSYVIRSAALARLAMMMGGRAAEMLLLDGDFTSGAYGDLDQARKLAGNMVRAWGMGPRLVMSDKDAERAVTDLIDEAAARATEVLTSHSELFGAVIDELDEHEEVDGAVLAAVRDRLRESTTAA